MQVFILNKHRVGGATYDCVIGKNEDDVNDTCRWPVTTFLLIIMRRGEHLMSVDEN